jgi:threonine/homoserine/homoserine lactone efflux protein
MNEQPPINDPPHPITLLTDEALQALLKRALRNTLILGLIVSVVLTISSGWRNGAMLMTGALISAASILEWQRLVRLVNARAKKEKAQRGAVLVVGFFLLRLVFFGAAIYGSLRCFQGSPIALVCGLSLSAATLMWEGFRMLRG